jgi:hypothetical protein
MREIKDKAATLFARDAAQPVNETTPSAIGPETIEWCRSLGATPPVYVPVRQDGCGLYGFCNISVAEKINTDGGTIRFGWIIWECPRVYLTAEFHAVWISPAGELIDITPKPAGESRIVFAADPSYPPLFDFQKRPNNRRRRLYRSADLAQLVRDRIAGFSPSQRDYEAARAGKKGLTLEQRIEASMPDDPIASLIDSFLRDADEHDTLWVTTPEGARCSNPRRVRELANSKGQKFRQIQVLLRRGLGPLGSGSD